MTEIMMDIVQTRGDKRTFVQIIAIILIGGLMLTLVKVILVEYEMSLKHRDELLQARYSPVVMAEILGRKKHKYDLLMTEEEEGLLTGIYPKMYEYKLQLELYIHPFLPVSIADQRILTGNITISSLQVPSTVITTFSTASSSSVVTPSSITSSDGTSVSAADVPPKPPRQDESGGSTVTVTSPVPIIVTLTSVDAPSFTSIVTTPIPMIVTLTSVDAPSFTSIRGNTPSAGLTSIDALSAGLTSIDGNAPVTITSSRVVALTASSTPTKAASVDDDSFFTDKPTVIGICVAAGLVLALLIGFCLFKISQRNKRRMEKEQDMENDEIIVGFAANTLAQREEEKQEKEENDGSGRDPNHFTRRNENYTLPRQRYGYGNGDYPGGPTDFGGVYGYPAPGQYAFNSNTVAAVVGNEQCLPNPYDRNEHQGSSAPHGSDKRMNSRVSLSPIQPEDFYGRNQNAYLGVPSRDNDWNGRNRGS
ncbi:hypothetical protein K435DRAFT_802160 [Dendrothele bispora CBS 962.96]|uniref:Uncharacterized protein n=1 Tax=Dendrothele bispora (strain CBS 962.96) TaxID=1314807 RepID=A0A4S8LMD8_DENBC|nr:hypothetical protein K435DRAFT_802160 [Dendrothele bispora CBS 962.96]